MTVLVLPPPTEKSYLYIVKPRRPTDFACARSQPRKQQQTNADWHSLDAFHALTVLTKKKSCDPGKQRSQPSADDATDATAEQNESKQTAAENVKRIQNKNSKTKRNTLHPRRRLHSFTPFYSCSLVHTKCVGWHRQNHFFSP